MAAARFVRRSRRPTPPVAMLPGLLIATLAAPAPLRADCIDYARQPHLAGGVNLPGKPLRVDVSGSIACVAADSLFEVVDVSNPEAPIMTGYIRMTAEDVVIRGGRAFVAAGDAGLYVVDISNPTAPAIVATLDTGSGADAIDAQGKHAFLAQDGQLSIINVSDWAHPFLAGTLPGAVRDVAAEGDLVYLLDFGVRIVDVSNPGGPVVIDTLGTTGMPVTAFDVSGGLACLASSGGSGGQLDLFDVTDPADPRHLGRVATSSWNHVTLADGCAIVTNDSPGTDHRLEVFGLSDPSTPRMTRTAELHGRDLSVSGAFACAVGESKLSVIALGDNRVPLVMSRLEVSKGASGIAVTGSLAFVNNWLNMVVIDFFNPYEPRILAEYPVSSEIEAVVSAGHYVFVKGSGSVHVIDVSNPAAPHETGYVGLRAPVDVAPAGDYVYVADATEGLHVLSISAGGHPRVESTLGLPGLSPECVAVSGSYAYVGCSSRLVIVDIHDPLHPVAIGTTLLGATSWNQEIAISGHYAYLTTSGPLQIVDIADPMAPRVIQGPDVGTVSTVSVDEHELYLGGEAGTNRLFWVFDITNPELPVVTTEVLAPEPTSIFGWPEVVATSEGIWVGAGRLYLVPRQCDAVSTVEATPPSQLVRRLRASPVPSSGAVTIELTAPASPGGARDRATAEVFDVHGRVLARVGGSRLSSGGVEFVWDGRDQRGREAPCGVYFVRVSGTTNLEGARVVLIR